MAAAHYRRVVVFAIFFIGVIAKSQEPSRRSDVVWSPCVQTLLGLVEGHPERLSVLSFSSAKSLPSDAGKYETCINANKTRYFMVQMDAKLGGMNMPVALGFCVPHVCEHDGVIEFMRSPAVGIFVPELALAELSNIVAVDPKSDLKPPGMGFSFAVFCFVMLTMSVMAASVVKGSQLDRVAAGFQPRELQTRCLQKLVDAFSVVGPDGSWQELVRTPRYKPTDCLNGVRVVSMLWIILGHTSLLASKESIVLYENFLDILASPTNPNAYENNPMLALTGVYWWLGVDSFFFLSGFLLAHLGLKATRRRLMDIFRAIHHRYVRLTPSLALALLFHYQISTQLGYGPFAAISQKQVTDHCDTTWMWTLTYTMNFYPWDPAQMCMGWSWYLGNDMVFYVVGLCILPIYQRKRRIGWFVLGILTCACFAVTFYLIFRHNLGIYVFDDQYTEYSYYLYSRPYTRAPAYFVGIALAWLINELEDRGFTRATRPCTRRAKAAATGAAWSACLLLIGLIFLPVTDYGDRKNSWDDWPIANAVFITFSRPLWACGCALLVFLCYYSYLPNVDGFLAHPIWTPLARLTYGAYLMHPSLNRLHGARALQFMTFSFLDVMSRFSFNCLIGFGSSMVLWILAERPCLALFSAHGHKGESCQLRIDEELCQVRSAAHPLVLAEKLSDPPSTATSSSGLQD